MKPLLKITLERMGFSVDDNRLSCSPLLFPLQRILGTIRRAAGGCAQPPYPFTEFP